jgi:hypothetical protein
MAIAAPLPRTCESLARHYGAGCAKPGFDGSDWEPASTVSLRLLKPYSMLSLEPRLKPSADNSRDQIDRKQFMAIQHSNKIQPLAASRFHAHPYMSSKPNRARHSKLWNTKHAARS